MPVTAVVGANWGDEGKGKMTDVLATGVVLDAGALLGELDGLATRGIPAPQLRISDRAQVVMPYHILLDECEEERLGAGQFGSTKVGMAPCGTPTTASTHTPPPLTPWRASPVWGPGCLPTRLPTSWP